VSTSHVAWLLLALLGCTTTPPPEPTPQLEEPGAVVPDPPPEVRPTVAAAMPATARDPSQTAKRWLGISVANMNDPIPGAPAHARAMIQRAFRGGPAHLAGLRYGDVIVRAAGVEVGRYQEYLAEARKVEIGGDLQLRVLRDGEPLDVTLRMVEQPEDQKRWRREHFPGTEAFAWEAVALRPEGARLSSEEANGRAQLLYFWATWCSPCRSTAPMIAELHQQAGERLLLVAISSEEQSKLAPWVEADASSYPVGRDHEGRAKLDYEVKSLPTAVLVGASGEVIAWDYGVGGVRRVVGRARDLIQATP
jgi:thiol-disulfide isomerase/thioredoxin